MVNQLFSTFFRESSQNFIYKLFRFLCIAKVFLLPLRKRVRKCAPWKTGFPFYISTVDGKMPHLIIFNFEFYIYSEGHVILAILSLDINYK